MVDVLDKGFVRLVDSMGDDSAIVQAARVSTGAGTKTLGADARLIRYLLRNAHWTPFEMVRFKFHIKAPIFVARQWFRHRAGSFNELSARYTEMPDEFWTPRPADLRAQGASDRQVGEGELSWESGMIAEQIFEAAYHWSYQAYQRLIDQGVSREQARAVLPVGLYTQWYWSVDLRNLLHFLDLRLDSHAQREIQVYAEALVELARPIAPVAFGAWNRGMSNG